MYRGFSLVELLLVIVITGLVLGITVPTLAPALDRLAVEQAAAELVAAHDRARIISILESRVVLLTIRPDSLIIQVVNGVNTLPRWAAAGPQSRGITLSGPLRSLTFAPIGISMGFSNATYSLSRGASTRQVIVSRYGRVRIQ